MIYRLKKSVKFILGKIYSIFNKSIENQGERVDIIYTGQKINLESLDMYQKSHYYRYQFAKEFIESYMVCGDFACGTGYGSVILAEEAKKVTGVDINPLVIQTIKKRYEKNTNVEFILGDLLKISEKSQYDVITSFETVEHFHEGDISSFFALCYQALKPNGRFIFSTPYKQEKSEAAIKLGFHLTFDINEEKIHLWLTDAGFMTDFYKYQNYQTHIIEDELEKKDFIICMAHKNCNS
jgi:cyclopropane fatty-acyl-phospholipid synthase-like methyltransferase